MADWALVHMSTIMVRIVLQLVLQKTEAVLLSSKSAVLQMINWLKNVEIQSKDAIKNTFMIRLSTIHKKLKGCVEDSHTLRRHL